MHATSHTRNYNLKMSLNHVLFMPHPAVFSRSDGPDSAHPRKKLTIALEMRRVSEFKKVSSDLFL